MNFIKKIFKDEIVRRYFVMNTFDGVLNSIGILIALIIAGIYNSQVIIVSCLGSGIAMGVSGIWGAYLIERAERKKKSKKETNSISSKNSKKSFIIALVDGLSPFFAILIILIPFFIFDVTTAYIISFILAAIIIISLGVFIAKIGHQNIFSIVVKLLLGAVIVTLIIYLMELAKII